MAISIPAPGSHVVLNAVIQLLQTRQYRLPNGAEIVLSPTTDTIVVESVRNHIAIDCGGVDLIAGASTIKYDGEFIVVNQVVQDLFAGINYRGVVLGFMGRKGFAISESNGKLLLIPLSQLRITAPLLKIFSLPDVDRIVIDRKGNGEVVINSIVKLQLELVDE